MACPVCFGGDDIAIRESLNAGIGILLGVTAIVLGAFLRFFFQLARRARESSAAGPVLSALPVDTVPTAPAQPEGLLHQ
jgi:hypothetical protein